MPNDTPKKILKFVECSIKHLGPVFGGPAENLPPQCLSGSGLFLRGAGEVQKMEVAPGSGGFLCFSYFFSVDSKTRCAQKTGKLWGEKVL